MSSLSISVPTGPSALARRRARVARDSILAGLLIGALDFATCSLFWATRDVPPARIARSLAELVLGSQAAQGGPMTVATGLLVEAGLGIAMVGLFVLAALQFRRMLAQPLRYGAAWGALAYAVYTWGVLPLSGARARNPGLDWEISLLLIYVIVLGIPTALLARRILAPQRR